MRAPSSPTYVAPRDAFEESGCLGMQPKIGGKSLLRLNNGERPIANKYREGKMKRTLKRELKVLEIVEGEGIGGCGCSRAYGARQRLCMHRVPVSIGCRGGIKAGFCSPPMPPLRSRSKGTPVPCGSVPSRCWQKASNPPVLKHGPRSLTCMRAGGLQTHDAQVT